MGYIVASMWSGDVKRTYWALQLATLLASSSVELRWLLRVITNIHPIEHELEKEI